jgi:hypothetical protein
MTYQELFKCLFSILYYNFFAILGFKAANESGYFLLYKIKNNSVIQFIYLRSWQRPNKAGYSQALKQQ